MYSYVYCSIIYNSKTIEAAQVSIDRGMDKEGVECVCVCVCVYNGILFSIKKEQNLAICNMDGARKYYAK